MRAGALVHVDALDLLGFYCELDRLAVRIFDIERAGVAVIEFGACDARFAEPGAKLILQVSIDLQRKVDKQSLPLRAMLPLEPGIGEVEERQRAAVAKLVQRKAEFVRNTADDLVFDQKPLSVMPRMSS